jgi:ornithine decarboxylase
MAPFAITVIETNLNLTNIHSTVDKTSYLEHNGGDTPKELIGNALRKRIEDIDHEACEPGDEDAFFVADLGEVYRQHMRWKRNLPRVKPFYGRFLLLQPYGHADGVQRSNATLTHRSSAF